MREKIVLTEKELAEKIQTKVNKFIETQIDSLTPNFRARGWLHKDDLVEGCGEVKEKCPQLEKCERDIIQPGECAKYPICNGTGTISRPLTLGELPERVRKMRGALIHIKEYWNEHDNVRAVTDALYEIQNTADDALKGD